MLSFAVGMLLASQSAAISQPPAVAETPVQPAAPAKPKKPKHKQCASGDEPAIGSHMFMDTCQTDQERAADGLKGAHVLRQSLVNGAAPLGGPH